MKIGWIVFNSQMMPPTKGRVLIAWHRKPWWTWGLWWHPFQAAFQTSAKHKIFRRMKKHWWLSLGKFGHVEFQRQA